MLFDSCVVGFHHALALVALHPVVGILHCLEYGASALVVHQGYEFLFLHLNIHHVAELVVVSVFAVPLGQNVALDLQDVGEALEFPGTFLVSEMVLVVPLDSAPIASAGNFVVQIAHELVAVELPLFVGFSLHAYSEVAPENFADVLEVVFVLPNVGFELSHFEIVEWWW
jgi:hypothetical protein